MWTPKINNENFFNHSCNQFFYFIYVEEAGELNYSENINSEVKLMMGKASKTSCMKDI